MSEEQDDIEGFRTGQVIFREGDRATCAYIIVEGSVELVKYPDSDAEVVLSTLGEGELLGEMGVLDDAPRSATARAYGPCRLRRIDRAHFLQYVSTRPQAAQTVIGRLSDRLRQTTALQVAASGTSEAGDRTDVSPATAQPAFFPATDRSWARTLAPAALVIGVVGAVIAVAAATRVETTISAQGEVATRASNARAEAEVTGTLDQMRVEEGDTVEKGQVLARLRTEQSRAELRKLQGRLESQQTRLARLRAEASALRGSAPEQPPASPVYAERMEAHRARMAKFEASLAAAKDRIDTTEPIVTAAENALAVERRILAQKETLQADGAEPKSAVLDARRQVASAREELARARQALNDAQSEAATIRRRRASYKRQRLAEVAERTESTAVEVDTLQADVDASQAELTDHVLRAPAAGTVLRRHAETPGAVVETGDPVLSIVRASDPLRVRAWVPQREIDGVETSMPVSVKLDALPFPQYGDLRGTVTYVAADATDREGASANASKAYRIWIRLDSKSPANAPAGFELEPGMRVTADLVTGSRTVLSYVTNPLVEAMTAAFSEPR